MKYCFLILLFLALFSCEKEDMATPNEQPAVTDFIIGATGGWGGSYAFKIADGQLQRSVASGWLGTPEQIANDVEFADYSDEDAAQLEQLAIDFPVAAFTAIPFKFDCEEQAWDGQCVYVIRKLDDGTVQFWTRSEFDEESVVTNYLDRAADVMYALYE